MKILNSVSRSRSQQSQQKKVSTEKISNQTLEMQMDYKKKFAKARQHIVALPPLDDPQMDVNQRLQKLCNHTKSNFVSTKAFRDRMTGSLRRNLMREYHYNDDGIKVLAHAIKKSIFSVSNIGNDDLTQMCEITTKSHSNVTSA